MRPAPSQEEVRRQNLGALLRFVHQHGAVSRAELTARTGLNRSTIGALTADLAAAGLVTEQAPRQTRRAGRPSPLVTPLSGAVCGYAVSVEVDRVQAARVGLGGVVLDRREAPRPPGSPVSASTDPLATFLTEMHTAAVGGAGPRTIGCGVAVTSRLRAPDGSVSRGVQPTEVDEPLRAMVTAALPDNPQLLTGGAADLAAYAEHTRGAATGQQNVIYLCGDGGLTAGIIADGRRFAGRQGTAGEVGHMVVRPDGYRCRCGSQGCWETEAGERALLHAAGASEQHGHEAVRAVVRAASFGDPTARAALRRVAEWLGLGTGNLINIFNPELVIFGGSLRDIFLAAAAPLRSRLNQVTLPEQLSGVRLRTPALGDDAALLGAAELAFEQLLADPLGSAAAA
ncbi:ROK family transcriptional regulator [Natronosporangium hydrolyticum]|uniref:ROK family transcriptional regulator n=1 Tax=Natronosporangium hydrolyticum TaxID=2811111 RepID=A0A895YE24_9ACTN|nr:ROK family transcriptional regulator [Natronosporangium hydrolyticum]QSB13693.1 ROK family transcriptional regulator [Natronosporangium hydrolyticum]